VALMQAILLFGNRSINLLLSVILLFINVYSTSSIDLNSDSDSDETYHNDRHHSENDVAYDGDNEGFFDGVFNTSLEDEEDNYSDEDSTSDEDDSHRNEDDDHRDENDDQKNENPIYHHSHDVRDVGNTTI